MTKDYNEKLDMVFEGEWKAIEPSKENEGKTIPHKKNIIQVQLMTPIYISESNTPVYKKVSLSKEEIYRMYNHIQELEIVQTDLKYESDDLPW